MQTIFVSGNLGKDPVLRTTQGGDDVLSFNVGVKQGWGDRASTNWFRCSVWGKRAKTLGDHLRKGTKVVVQGDLTIGEYEGKPQYDIRASEIEFMSRSEGGAQRSESQGGGNDQSDDDWDSVPF